MMINRRSAGFSLVELLVVIAILGTLIGLTLAAIQRVRSAAACSECTDHLRQIGLALHNYHGVYKVFPPGCSNSGSTEPYPFMSWSARLLPFLEQEALWRQTLRAYQEDRRFLHNPPHIGLVTVMPIFACPADGRTFEVGKYAAFTSYLGVEGNDLFTKDGILYLNSSVRLADVVDGTSNTLFVGERPPSADQGFGWWYAGEGQDQDGSADLVLGVREWNVGSIWARGCPEGEYTFQDGRVQNQCDAFHFWSLHPGGGANFLFADGSVHFLPYSAAPLLPALATRAGGEAASWDE
jgi:prepilin-type N-terminal cleavage/methylation domain-containing protein/prepilin-type processing-associated H-X9-DG protein